MCAVLHGVYLDFFKMAAGNFAWNRVFSCSLLFFWGGKQISIFEIFWIFWIYWNFWTLKKIRIFKVYENFDILLNFYYIHLNSENLEIFRNLMKYFIFDENLGKQCFLPKFTFSVFVINVSFLTSVVGKCTLCNKWWNSFMNQKFNKNVNII